MIGHAPLPEDDSACGCQNPAAYSPVNHHEREAVAERLARQVGRHPGLEIPGGYAFGGEMKIDRCRDDGPFKVVQDAVEQDRAHDGDVDREGDHARAHIHAGRHAGSVAGDRASRRVGDGRVGEAQACASQQ